jgi:hypothetical protein
LYFSDFCDGRLLDAIDSNKYVKDEEHKIAEFYSLQGEVFPLEARLLSTHHLSGRFELRLVGNVFSVPFLESFEEPLL